MKHTIKAMSLAIAAMTCQHALAGPADYVYTPHVEYGEKEIDYKFGIASKKGEEGQRAESIGFGYGATQRWFTEVYLKYTKTGAEGWKYDAIEWENKFQLTEPGEYPVDIGLLVEFERPQDRREGYEVKFGALFQKDIDKFQLNGNVLFERKYHAVESGPMAMGYQWQAKYRYSPAFQFGLQGFGDLGPWDHWDRSEAQSHRAGPAVFGKIPLGNRQALKYNAAWLLRASDAAPNHTFRMQVEYEF